jgi:hypothetical protein
MIPLVFCTAEKEGELQGKRELPARENNHRKKKRCADEGVLLHSIYSNRKGPDHLGQK